MDTSYRIAHTLRHLGGARTCAEIAQVARLDINVIADEIVAMVDRGALQASPLGGYGIVVPAFRLPSKLAVRADPVLHPGESSE